MSVINHPFNANLLNTAVQQFEQWRATRGKRGPIPDRLKKLIPPLDGLYGHNEIAKALRINHGQVKTYLSLYTKEPTPPSMTLVECLVPPILSTPETQSATLTFSCKNGRPATIKGLRGTDIATAISTLVGG